jgi:hypothetical protein
MGGGSYPGPWRFTHYPWTREMLDSEEPMCIGQKAAQMAFTEVCLNRTFFKLDIRKCSSGYILPAKNPDASDFSASRFDGALECSPYLQKLFSDVKNVGHKRAGSVSLYIRGSRSRGGLKSFPAGFLVFDELDEMVQENLPLAFERQSGQLEKQTWMISTPTIDTTGINGYFVKSKQKEFFFKCPSCGRMTELTFPECIVIPTDDPTDRKIKGTYYICKECNSVLEHATKSMWLANGIWVPKSPDKEFDGYHINQMYSPTIEPWQIAESYLFSLSSPAHEQEFFNSKLGLPHIIKGARISDQDLVECIGDYKNGTTSTKLVTMGIDIGRWLHYVIVEYTIPNVITMDINMNAKARVLEINKVLSFEELDTPIKKHMPASIVVDSQPDRRKAYEFAQRYWGHVWLNFYGNNVAGKQISKTKDTDGRELEYCVTTDRTSWLDLSLSRFTNRTIQLPLDCPTEFKEHIKALVRKPGFDKLGNPTAKYINLNDDHYAHARNYSEIALNLVSGGSSANIRSPI